MRRVTLLLSGVPQFVTLRDLSYNLDLLFNTDEIETFKIRDLPNHPQTNKRQIALDFRSSYDAMAAQEKLDGYTFELDNGREYTLHAKINKLEEYMCSESMEYEGSRWHGDDWMALAMIPNVSDRDMYKAHARLDAQLQLLNKQKLVLEKEKELLSERQTLKRKYGTMVSCLYEVATPWTQPNHNVEGCKSETEVSPPKISRSTSRDRWSSSKPLRSRSRDNRPRDRSRSKDSYDLPQIEWYEKTRELRSQSRERPRSSANCRDRRSSSRDRRDNRYSRHREQRSRSNDKDKNRRSTSRERGVRARSRSKERLARSRESRSKERRSRSREQMSYRRSRSRDRTRHDRRGSRSDRDRRGRRLRSPDRKTKRLAIMPKSPRGNSPSGWSTESLKAAATPPGNTKHRADISNKQVYKFEKDANNTAKEAYTKENKSDNCMKNKDIEKKKVDKYYSKIKKAEKTTSRVQALSKDIMIIVAIVVDEIMDKHKIRITASNKLTFINILDELVQQRLGPIARVKKYDDKEVLRKYKKKYPMEGDLIMMKQMMDEIPKLDMKVPEATVTVCSESEKSNVRADDILDVDSGATEQECNPTNLTQVESTDNAPQIKREPTEAPIIIIDIDSADKSVPRHPQFVVVIKTLLKNMNNVIRTNKLGEEIKFTDLKHVLRSILRRMLKGQGFLPREEIIRRFREVHPKANDELFVRNAIKDIKEGKYPALTGHVDDSPVPVNDGPDDIIVIEKQYDVVTVLDSDDDDDVDKKPIDTSKVTINLDCESPKAKPNANPSQPTPGPSNVNIKTDPVNPDQSNPGSTNSVQDTPCSNTGQTTLSDIPGEAKTSPTDPGQASTGPANTNQANIDANPCQAKTDAKPGQDMPEPFSPVRANTGIPSQAYTGSVSLGQAKTDVPNASQANVGFANISQALPCSVDAGQAKKGAYNPGQTNIDAPNPSKANTGFVNLSLAMTRSVDASQAKKGPNNPVQAMPRPVNANKGPNNPSQANIDAPNPSNTNTGFANLSLAMTRSVDASQAKKGPNNPVQAMPRPVNANKGPNNPSQDKTGLINPGHAKTVSGNPNQANIDAPNPSNANTGFANLSLAMTRSVDASQAKKGPNNPVQAMPRPVNTNKGPNNPSQDKTGLINPGHAKTVSGNPNQANIDAPNPSNANTGFANLSLAMTRSVDASQAKKGPNNPVQAMPRPVNANKGPNNPSQDKTGLINPGHAKTVSGNPGQAKKGPNNGGQAKECLSNPSLAKTCPGNPGQDKSVAGYPGQAKKGPRNAGQAKLSPNNPSKAKTVPGDPSQSKKGSNNAGQANKGPNNSGQAKTASGNLGQAKDDPANVGQTKTTVNTSQATTGFANPSQAKTISSSSQAALNNKENQKRASLDNTIQNLENSYDSDVVVISSPSGKVASSRKRKKRSRKRKSAGKFQESPAKGKNNSPEDSKDQANINAIEDNDNNLKVTAITILTSLNELIAKSNANDTEVEEPNEIKKEIEIEEDNLDESSLQLPDGPRVTAITIMTSEAELFSLGQEDRKEVDEIKNESDVYYDAEDNLVNDIQRAFDNASFCNSMQSERNEQNNSVNSELFSGVNNSEQFTSKAAGVPQDSRTGQDDEETIESIVKYVASMY